MTKKKIVVKFIVMLVLLLVLHLVCEKQRSDALAVGVCGDCVCTPMIKE